MKKRKWTSQEKLRIVLEGLSGNIEINKLGAKYKIAQTQYYQWHDQHKVLRVLARFPHRLQ